MSASFTPCQFHQHIVSSHNQLSARTVHRAISHNRRCPRTLHRISYRYGDKDVRFKPRGEWTTELSDHLLAAGQGRNGVVENPLCPLVYNQSADDA